MKFRRFKIFDIFWPVLSFGEISFLASLLKSFSVSRNAYFSCVLKVRQVLQNSCMRIFGRFNDFFAHRGPLGKSQFWQVWSKSGKVATLVEMHILGVIRSVGC